MMNDRDRLIELIEQAEGLKNNDFPSVEEIADHLLANGVIVPPCNVGDTVYVKWRLTKASKYCIYPAKVYALRWDEKKNNFRVCVDGDFRISAYGGYYTHYYRATFSWDNVGKTVFLTKEKAEQKLKGLGK